jgi:DNA repair protein RecN (Recombination protein N)
MDHAVFEIAVEPVAAESAGPRGGDRVEFRLTTNPGEELRPLARVASGGELSRTMLALLTVLAAADPVPTMIFDEIDAGLGARLAGVVAEQLAAVAEGRQVICVTHQAAIAARARRHIRVVKSVRRGRTRTTAVRLEGQDRVGEIARMLSGDAAAGPAMEHARALLDRRWL